MATIKERIDGVTEDVTQGKTDFEVCFCIVKNGEVLFTTSGQSYGFINNKLVGKNGFGYDPLFVGNDTFGKTYAELDSARKNLRSHRKSALKDLALWMTQNISNE